MENKIVSREATEKYNAKHAKTHKIPDSERQDCKGFYLMHMDIPRDRRDGDYDVKLVSCDDHGKIVDNNHVMLTVKTSAIMWGVILAVVLIIFGLASIFGSSTFLSVLIMVTAVGILITIFYSLYNCLTKLISKRDLNFKVYSLFELLPLVLVILVIQALFGLEVLVGSAVMLLFIGFIGAIFLIILKILF